MLFFPDKFDSLILNKTDSIYLNKTRHEEMNEWWYFTGEIGIRQGSLVFYYANRWSGKYWYEEINLPYEEYEKYLFPQYHKLLKPSAPKAPGQKQ